MKGKTNSSGNSGADIKNSQIEVSTALEKIEANSFIEKTIETSIAQGTVQPRRYKFPGTDYTLIEPRSRTYYYGLGNSSTSSSTKVSVQIEHNGTKKTVASIPDRAPNQSKGYLVQVLPVSTNSFIAVYCWSTEYRNAFSTYYNANRIISFVVYELDTTMSTATIAVDQTQLPFIGGTDTTQYSSDISNCLPYYGMAITGVFPTTFDKCFVLSVYRCTSWVKDEGPKSPTYTGTLVYCDYSRGSMTMTQKDMGCVPIFADLARSDIDRAWAQSVSMSINRGDFQPYSEDGVYERIVAVSQVDSSQNTYTAGLYFIRFDILKTSKNITLYPASFIKSLSDNYETYSFAALSKKMSEDNTKKATFIQLMQKDMYGTGNTESLRITISMASDGYVDNIDYVNLSLSVDTVGRYGTESFSINGTSSGYTKMQAIGITNGIMIGLLTHSSSLYYTNDRNGILPIFFSPVAENAEAMHFKLIGFETLSSYQNNINSFSGELYDFVENILGGNGVLQARYAMQTNYNVCFKGFMPGIKKAVASIDGLSKETAAIGKPVRIATLKA